MSDNNEMKFKGVRRKYPTFKLQLVVVFLLQNTISLFFFLSIRHYVTFSQPRLFYATILWYYNTWTLVIHVYYCLDIYAFS